MLFSTESAMTARAAKAGCCCELLWLIVEMAIADRRVKLGRNFGGETGTFG